MRSHAEHLGAVQVDAQVTQAQILQLLAVHSRYLRYTAPLIRDRWKLLSQLSANLHVASVGAHSSSDDSQFAARDVVQKMQCNLYSSTDAFVTMMREWMMDVLRPFQVIVDHALLWQFLLRSCPLRSGSSG